MRLIDADAFDRALQGAQAECRKQGGNFRYGVLSTVRENLAMMPTVEMPGWISVNERLPEDGQFVVVRHEVKGRIYSEVAHYIMDLWWLDWDTNGLELNAISWMPLPEPPKEV